MNNAINKLREGGSVTTYSPAQEMELINLLADIDFLIDKEYVNENEFKWSKSSKSSVEKRIKAIFPTGSFSKELAPYQEWLSSVVRMGRQETPKHLEIKTLWIPFVTSNRTVTIDLNHTMGEFNKDGILVGYNGNCDTPYAIVPIPIDWDDNNVIDLAISVADRIGEEDRQDPIRLLRGDRVEIIIEEIQTSWDEALKNT